MQFSVFSVAGVFVLYLAVADLWERRDPYALLLFLWVLGSFVFAAQVNWTTNARALLPMAPPVGILLVRRLELRAKSAVRPSWRLWAPLIPGAMLTMTLMYADYRLANSARQAATHFQEGLPEHEGKDWYVGHWGFQYYMELGDATPIDVLGTEVNPGDTIIIPQNNLNKLTIPEIYSHGYAVEFDVFPWVTTWNRTNRAGFYSNTWGNLPYAFGRVPNERYSALLISQTETLRWEELDSILAGQRPR